MTEELKVSNQDMIKLYKNIRNLLASKYLEDDELIYLCDLANRCADERDSETVFFTEQFCKYTEKRISEKKRYLMISK